MWQLSNLQIDSSVIQIVQSDVLRNSVDTTAAITNIFNLNSRTSDSHVVYMHRQDQHYHALHDLSKYATVDLALLHAVFYNQLHNQ